MAWLSYMANGAILACAVTSMLCEHNRGHAAFFVFGGMLLIIFLIPYSWYTTAKARTHPALDAVAVPIVVTLLKAATNDRWQRYITEPEHWLCFGFGMWSLAMLAGAITSAMGIRRCVGYVVLILLFFSIVPNLVE